MDGADSCHMTRRLFLSSRENHVPIDLLIYAKHVNHNVNWDLIEIVVTLTIKIHHNSRRACDHGSACLATPLIGLADYLGPERACIDYRAHTT